MSELAAAKAVDVCNTLITEIAMIAEFLFPQAYSSIHLYTVVVAIVGLGWLWWRRPNAQFPPGPRGFPIVGVLPYLGKYPQRVFREWAFQYGPIMSVKMGGRDVVFLNTCDVITQALVKQGNVFSGRPPIDLYNQVLGHNGITFMDYTEQQIASKKFAIQSLKKFGFGKDRMEDIITEETSLYMDYLCSKQNERVSFDKELLGILCNVISKFVLGRRFAYDDPLLGQILKVGISQPHDSKCKQPLLYFYKYVRFFQPYKGANERFIKGEVLAREAREILIGDHKNKFDSNNINDFVDAYLTEQKFGQNKHLFSDIQLNSCIRDLVFAGTNDMKILLLWDILGLLNYPEYYEKILKEIDSVIGNTEKPKMSHKRNMPIISAFLHEVWRYCTIVPNAVVHRTTEDATLNEFYLPKGTHVVPNLYAAHRDPNVWSEPEKFNPMRHINGNGEFVHSTKVIPCCVGPRYCFGKYIAHVEEFLFIAALMQKCTITSPTNPLPTLDNGETTLLYTPRRYEVILVQR